MVEFEVQTTLLQSDESVRICGSHATIGSWLPEKGLQMHKVKVRRDFEIVLKRPRMAGRSSRRAMRVGSEAASPYGGGAGVQVCHHEGLC